MITLVKQMKNIIKAGNKKEEKLMFADLLVKLNDIKGIEEFTTYLKTKIK